MTNNLSTQSNHHAEQEQYAQMKRSFELKDNEGLSQNEYIKLLRKVTNDLTRTRDPLLNTFWNSIDLLGAGTRGAIDTVSNSIKRNTIPANIEKGQVTSLPQYKEDQYN